MAGQAARQPDTLSPAVDCVQAAAERQLREQGQLASAAAAGAQAAAAAAEAPAADAPAADTAAAGGGDAGAAAAGVPGKKGKVVTAKDKEEALLKAKRKELMERAGGLVK